nr:hypothetical protein [Lachnospiraceae bacterium]
NGDVVCSNCKSREESVFEEIRDYLYDNPGTKDTELIEKFDVTRKTITQWIRDGRIELTPESAIKIHCRRCNEPILKGELCEKCQKQKEETFNKLKHSVKKEVMAAAVVARSAPRHENKMRYLGKHSAQS